MKRFFTALFRNIKKNPLYTAINLFGLVLGFMCIVLITIWVKNELSYDTFHKNTKDIYRVHRYFYDPNGEINLHLSNVAPPVAPLLEKEFPVIQAIARVYHINLTFKSGNQLIEENDVGMADPAILKIFDFEGLPEDKNLLAEPFTMIVSDEVANKYFKGEDVIGKSLEFKDEQAKSYQIRITGVFKKWGQNSHFKPGIFASFGTLEALAPPDELEDWSSNNYETFALIPNMPANFDNKLDAFIDKYLDNGTNWTKLRVENLADIHFNWYSSRSYIYILGSIAFLILIIGSINYMNLNVVMYSRRIREIKIKKIIGASQKKLNIQLMLESVIFCFVALTGAIILAWYALPAFNKILDSPLKFGFSENIGLITGLFVLSVLTGILSVIYPVIILSSYKPATTSKTETAMPGKPSIRSGLVVFQFMVSIGLIISFLFVQKQLTYLNNKELGLEKENIIVIPATPQLVDKLDVFKQQLKNNPNILSISASKRAPSNGLWDSNGAKVMDNGNFTPVGFRLACVRVDEDFIPTYKITLAAGRNFDEKDHAGDSYIINESAVKKLGWGLPENAIGQVIDYGGVKGNVIGVVKDFYYESLHNPISPIIIYKDPSSFNRVSIRITPYESDKTLAFIERTWEEYNISNFSFYHEYVNDRYKRLYAAEKNVKAILNYFMIIAISIAILGLVGLSVFMIQRRTKEIGIRKVNGARISEVVKMLNKDFLLWVILAFTIASPLAWYAVYKWLENFAYKTELSWWIFALAGLMALGIALLTVSWQSWRAATRNPVEALRYE